MCRRLFLGINEWRDEEDWVERWYHEKNVYKKLTVTVRCEFSVPPDTLLFYLWAHIYPELVQFTD
jgi:hypothetical protein